MFSCRVHFRANRWYFQNSCRDCALMILLEKVRCRLKNGEKENDITLDELRRYKKAKNHPQLLVELGKLNESDSDTSSDSSSSSDSS